MSQYRYLFNTAGSYVGFVQGGHVFDPDCNWLGFLRMGNEFYSPQGIFIGYILDDDRVVRRKDQAQKMRVSPPFKPFKPFKPFAPFKRIAKPRLPYPYEDVYG